MPEQDRVVRAEGVSRVFEEGRVVALRDVTLAVRRGEWVAVSGRSGSGKSTLLHVLSGLDRPTAGRVWVEEREPASPRQWARLRARRIGVVFQAYHLLPTLTALENVEVPMLGVLPGASARRRRALALLEQVGLAGREAHRPADLSGGERQRVAIARSLANGPGLLLADEPTGNLDSATAAGVLDLLGRLRETTATTVVLVTHDPEVAARADRQIRMADGRVVGP